MMISDIDLEAMLRQLREESPNSHISMMYGAIRSRGMKESELQ